jgi:hypothetical protein
MEPRTESSLEIDLDMKDTISIYFPYGRYLAYAFSDIQVVVMNIYSGEVFLKYDDVIDSPVAFRSMVNSLPLVRQDVSYYMKLSPAKNTTRVGVTCRLLL